MVNLDYLYNPEPVRKFFNTNLFSDRKLGFQIIENGMILPHKDVYVGGRWTWGKGGIVDSEGNYLKNSHVHYGIGGAYTPPLQEIKHSSEAVIYLGLFYPTWGHIITDDIRRMWFLKSEFFKSEFKNCPLVYIPWNSWSLDRHLDFKRLLEILEINVDNLQPITQPTQFDKIILPDESFYRDIDNARKFTKEYRETIDHIRNFALKNRTPTSIKKLYFLEGRGQVGEMRLAEYFKSKGYEIITSKQQVNHLDEELNLLINAESFASTLGSCAHNSVFLRDGTETIFIPRLFNGFTGYQQPIDQMRSLNANYVDSSLSIFVRSPADKAQCYILSKQLKRFFGDKFDGYEEEDFKAFLDYIRGSVRGMRIINPTIVKGYGAVFTDFMEQLKKREDLITACDMPPSWETFRPMLNYITHVHMKGGRDGWKGENQLSNSLDQKLDVRAIRLNFPIYKLYYSVYFNDEEGWSPEVLPSEVAGSVDNTKSIFGMRVRFDEAGSKEFDILYRMHKFDDTWTPWAKNGEALYSHGIKLNAIQIKLEPKT